jgi:hypothetical protein
MTLSAATSDCWRRQDAPHRHRAHRHRSNHPGMHRSPAAPVMSGVLQDVLTAAPKHTLLLKHRSPLAQNNHSQAAAPLLCGPSSQQTTTTTAQQEAVLAARPTAHRCLRCGAVKRKRREHYRGFVPLRMPEEPGRRLRKL